MFGCFPAQTFSTVSNHCLFSIVTQLFVHLILLTEATERSSSAPRLIGACQCLWQSSSVYWFKWLRSDCAKKMDGELAKNYQCTLLQVKNQWLDFKFLTLIRKFKNSQSYLAKAIYCQKRCDLSLDAGTGRQLTSTGLYEQQVDLRAFLPIEKSIK